VKSRGKHTHLAESDAMGVNATKEQWHKKEKSWSFKLYRDKDDRANNFSHLNNTILVVPVHAPHSYRVSPDECARYGR